MCILADFTKPKQTTRTLYAYKAVRIQPDQPECYTSIVGPLCRVSQPIQKVLRQKRKELSFYHCSRGKRMEYALGVAAVSDMDETPGIYCCTSEKRARRIARTFGVSGRYKVLKVRIPKGTKIVRGSMRDERGGMINAEKIVPMEEV